MASFVIKRILLAIPTLIVLMTLTFAIMKAAPGGPFDSEKALPDDVRANLEAKYHLDKPLVEQYFLYLGNLVRGDLGPSYRYLGTRSVGEVIAETLPISMILGFWALLFAIGIGIPLGVASAYFRHSWIDISAMFMAIAGVSLPNYLVASALILIFSMYFQWLPPALWDDWTSAVLPTITLGLRPMALIARMTRASMLDVLNADYVRMAYAKGAGTLRVLFVHALKNALVPILTILGPITAAIITGSFVVEVIFAIPGMGRHFVSAVVDRDYTLILGVTLTYGIIVIIANLLVDMLYAWADPRIRVKA